MIRSMRCFDLFDEKTRLVQLSISDSWSLKALDRRQQAVSYIERMSAYSYIVGTYLLKDSGGSSYIVEVLVLLRCAAC